MMKNAVRVSHGLQNDRGYVLASVGLSLAAFLGFLALVTDLGNIFVTKAQLQNTADSAALAAVVEIPSGETISRQSAINFGNTHWAGGAQIVIGNSDVLFGKYNFQTSAFEANQTPYNSVMVTAKRTSDSGAGALPLFFAGILGRSVSNVRAVSLAVLDPHVVGVTGKNRLIPYSVIDFVADPDLDGNYEINSIININPRNDAPGNFGFLDLDGGSNDTPELRNYIENGYDKEFTIPPNGSLPVSGSTGIEGNSLLNSFSVILDQIVFLPVHHNVEFNGSGAIFHVVDILAVKIQQVKLNGNLGSRFIRVKVVNFASSVLLTDPDAPENNSVAKPRLAA